MFYDHNDGFQEPSIITIAKILETFLGNETINHPGADNMPRRSGDLSANDVCRRRHRLTFPSAAQSLIKKAWIEADARREHFSHVKT